MNILFLLHSYPKVGGIEVVTHTISQYLGRRHNLYYLARVSVPCEGMDDTNCYYFKSRKVKEARAYLEQLVASLDIDVIINQGPFIPYNKILQGLQADGRRVRIYSFLHFMPGFDFERAKYAWMYERRGLKRCIKRLKTALGLDTAQLCPDKIRRKYRKLYALSDKVVVLSPSYIDLFKRYYRQGGGDKLTYLPNPSRYANQGTDALGRKGKVVLFVGRLEFESKRLDRLVSIWSSIKDHAGWQLKIVGDGPYYDGLKELMDTMNVSDVSLLGQQDDVSGYYKEASVVVLTSSFEGLSLCFIEALQFGCVPLTFDVSAGNRDVISRLSPSLLVKPFDLQAYASVLSRLMSDDVWRSGLSLRALEVGETYSLDNVGRLWDRLLG